MNTQVLITSIYSVSKPLAHQQQNNKSRITNQTRSKQKMAAKALKITTMLLMLVMVLMHHIQYAASDSQACKGDCAKTCTDGEEVDFDCFLSCVEKCDDDDDDDDYPPILIGISSSLLYVHTCNTFTNYVG